MRKLRLCVVFMAFHLMAAPLSGGGSLAQDNYTIQSIFTNSGNNFIGYLQGISGQSVNNISDNGLVTVGFTNFQANGIYNAAYGIGSFRNQGSLAFVNIRPNEIVNPVSFLGQTFSQGNRALFNNYNYAVNLNFNGFQAQGIVLLNVMAGSFTNQFTSLSFNMGKNAIASSTPSVFNVVKGSPTVVALTNQQMAAIAATADNDIKVLGKQSAMTSVQGTPNVQGVCAMTISAGVNNLVTHNVGVNIDTK